MKTKEDLLKSVKKLTATFLQNADLMLNERDFQVKLAGKYLDAGYSVDLEYFIPSETLPDYPWSTERLRIDIVVGDGVHYVPVELKFKTKYISENKLTFERFGERVSGTDVMVTQGANNHGRYDFWKDVKRLELLNERFDYVAGGLAVFVTNDPYYETDCGGNNAPCAMNEGSHACEKGWMDESMRAADGRPNFKLSKNYAIEWKADMKTAYLGFKYCMVQVDPMHEGGANAAVDLKSVSEHDLITELRSRGNAVVVWTPKDIELEFNLSAEESKKALGSIAKPLQDFSVSQGWDFIHSTI